MEGLDRLIDGDGTIEVLDDQATSGDVDLRDALEVDASPPLELLLHEALVAEGLGAQQGDGQEHGIDSVTAGWPALRLHRPEPGDLARRADDGKAWVRRQTLAGEVEGGERHRLVVEAARGRPDVGSGGDHRRDGLPWLIRVR